MDTKKVSKNIAKFYCNKCDYTTSSNYDYTKHCMTAKHLMDTKNVSKNIASFHCKKCDYTTSTNCNYKKHCMTAKHMMDTNKSKCIIVYRNSGDYKCDCGKMYKYSQGLYKHKKTCSLTYCNKSVPSNLTTAMVVELIKENQEFKSMLVEQQKENSILMNKMMEISQNSLILPTTINNNNTTNNNQFNLNLFLNETCKNAINFTDFIDNIQVTDNDLENNARMGFVDGVTKIIMDNLKQLELNNRPIHCTDVKRETIYVKEENQWEKDNSKEVIQKGIQEITRKNMCQLSEWRENNPEYEDMETETGEKSIIMQQNSMAGVKRDAFYPKIIKKIAKETIIDR